jgi:hypothetical protein
MSGSYLNRINLGPVAFEPKLDHPRAGRSHTLGESNSALETAPVASTVTRTFTFTSP